jgi:hypothetical protein
VVDIAKGTEDVYTAFALFNTSLVIGSGIGCIFFAPLCFLSASYAHKAIQWNRGRTWLRQSEDIWLELIDCNEHSSTTNQTTLTVISYLICNQNFSTGSAGWQACVFEICDGDLSTCLHEVTYNYPIFTGKKSDGLLCGATQIGDGITEDYHYEAMGVNHSEETNTTTGTTLSGNDEMRRVFNLVWDRDPTDFFQTNIR